MVHPWAWPSPGSYFSQGFSRGGVGTSRVRLPPTGTGTMALKPPFSSLYYCSEVPGPEASSLVPWPLVVPPLPRSSLPVGIGGWHYRRLNLASPQPGDAHTRRRPKWSTYWLPPLWPIGGSHHTFDLDFDFDFGQRPRTGRYNPIPLALEKTKAEKYMLKTWKQSFTIEKLKYVFLVFYKT